MLDAGYLILDAGCLIMDKGFVELKSVMNDKAEGKRLKAKDAWYTS